MALDVEMMKLQKIAMSEAEKTKQIDDLRASQTIRSDALNAKGGVDLALYGGADRRWAQWVQAKTSELNTQKAALIAKREEQKQTTQKAFGKDEAVRRLVDSAEEAIRSEQSRS